MHYINVIRNSETGNTIVNITDEPKVVYTFGVNEDLQVYLKRQTVNNDAVWDRDYNTVIPDIPLDVLNEAVSAFRVKIQYKVKRRGL